MAVYSSGIQLEWREVEGGQLPSSRWGPRATLVGDVLFGTGGFDDGANYLTSFLSWDPVTFSINEISLFFKIFVDLFKFSLFRGVRILQP